MKRRVWFIGEQQRAMAEGWLPCMFAAGPSGRLYVTLPALHSHTRGHHYCMYGV